MLMLVLKQTFLFMFYSDIELFSQAFTSIIAKSPIDAET